MKYVIGELPGIEGRHDIAVMEQDTHLSTWVAETGRLDTDQMLPQLREFVKQDSVAYDVGSHIGDHAAFYASRCPKAVVAFEAFPDAFACLEHNLEYYRSKTSVQLFNTCVGNGEVIDLRKVLPTTNPGARRLLVGEEGKPTTRLDDLVATGIIPPPTFMKLDVEGWEVKVLQGAVGILANHRPVIVCEINKPALLDAGDSQERLHATLRGYGYSMVDVFTRLEWNIADDRPQFDILAKPWT